MGDADRNLDEQIRGVEEEIRSVGEEIRIVGQKIDRVEEQIETCSDLQEKDRLRRKEDRLRGEKDRLRGEKDRLRGKEAQLRGEKAQLREQTLQGRDLGTEYEWLVQKVVAPAPHSGMRIYPSSSNHDRIWIPVEVEHWDVRGDIEEFLTSADKRKRVYNIAIASLTRDSETVGKQDVHTVNYILLQMLAFMKKKEPQSEFRFEPQARLLTRKGGENDGIGLGEDATASGMVKVYTRSPIADFLVKSSGKNASVVEVKNGGLGSDGDDLWNLHEAWTECSCKTDAGEGDRNCRCGVWGITPAHREKVLRCINQLYEYMVLSKVGYGVLTDVKNWYIFKRDNAGRLEISPGFKAGGEPPRALAAFSYLVHTSLEDNSEFGDPSRNGRFPVVPEVVPSEPSDESTDDYMSDPNYPARGNNTSVFEIRGSGRTRSGREQWALQDVSAEDLNLKKAGGIISCEGWGGCVVIGRLHGQPVALKFAFLGTERAEALLNEVDAYMKMEKLWGFFVPRLIGYGTTNKGRVVFVATELIEGVELGEVVATEEVVTAALQALDAIHACGLLHGDVSSSNIMVVWGKQPLVRILDFGFSSVTRDKKLLRAERKRLKGVLTHMVK